eukprot:TRINITY_DN6035_c0_g1_i1.p1 TRINITY_DN6035_c0_g1~~TRINITY_DN6035_c0_g1_i1.p1  ORF type:complete len:274 (-),score=48.86 TRINITY_DN6035_c0_g1_i1:47-769(-)
MDEDSFLSPVKTPQKSSDSRLPGLYERIAIEKLRITESVKSLSNRLGRESMMPLQGERYGADQRKSVVGYSHGRTRCDRSVVLMVESDVVSETTVEMLYYQTFAEIVEYFEKRYHLKQGMVLMYDGVPLCLDDTPSQCDMKDGDVIRFEFNAEEESSDVVEQTIQVSVSIAINGTIQPKKKKFKISTARPLSKIVEAILQNQGPSARCVLLFDGEEMDTKKNAEYYYLEDKDMLETFIHL